MLLDIILNYHKRKLEFLINKGFSYDKILRQSQKLDKYINKKMSLLNNY